MGGAQQILFWSGVLFYSLVGLDSGYYQTDTNRYALAYLLHLEKGADKSLIVDENYSFNIELELGKPPSDSTQHSGIGLDELLSILAKEKKKDLLIVKFHKLVLLHGREEEFLESLEDPLIFTGYKRVVFLGSSSMGTHYLADIKSTD